jgi:hypothetical protein
VGGGGKMAGIVKLTTRLHLVPRLKNTWRYTSTPPYVFMAWCLGTRTLPSPSALRTKIKSFPLYFFLGPKKGKQ